MSLLPCISVRPAWCWMILNAGKDIENRTWKTKVRGRVLLHASKGMTQDEWFGAILFANRTCGVPSSVLKNGREIDRLQRGALF